jgi:hypothetical protein
MELEKLNSAINDILNDRLRSFKTMVSDCESVIDNAPSEWHGDAEFIRFKASVTQRLCSAALCSDVSFSIADKWYNRALASGFSHDFWRVSATILFCQTCLEKRRTRRALSIALELKEFVRNRPELIPGRESQNIEDIISEARSRMKRTADTKRMRRKQRRK